MPMLHRRSTRRFHSRRRFRRHRGVAGALVALLAAACGQGGVPSQPPAGGPVPRVEAGAPTTLAPGQSVVVGESDALLRVTFARVAGDSRCRPGQQCVWEGEVAVELRLAHGGSDTVVTLHSVRDPRRVEHAGHTILLDAVTPTARRGAIPPADYRATLVMERR